MQSCISCGNMTNGRVCIDCDKRQNRQIAEDRLLAIEHQLVDLSDRLLTLERIEIP